MIPRGSTIILQALSEGHLSDTEYNEWLALKARLKRLEGLSWAIAKGEKDPETTGGLTQQDVADILGSSQQAINKSEQSALRKVRAFFKSKGFDRHIV